MTDPLTTHKVTAPDGVHLHVTEVGDPDAPAVLLLHGVGSSSRFLLDTFGGPLAAAGWRVLAADLRGHGRSSARSDPEALGYERHRADVAALADRFMPAVLAGVSLGGHAAVGAATAGVPCRAVVACLPAWTGRATPGQGPHATVAAQARHAGITAMVEAFRRDDTMVPWLRDVLVRDWPTHDPASLAAALSSLDGGHAPTRDEVARLPVPLGVVGWPDDPGHPLAVARDWAAAAPTGTLVSTTLAAMEADRQALGDAAAQALSRLGIRPDVSR